MAEAARKLSVETGKQTNAPQAPRGGVSTWQPFTSLRREMDRLFDDFTAGWPRLGAMDEPAWAGSSKVITPIQLEETDRGYRLTCEVPGMAEGDLQVAVADDRLTIKGEKKEQSDEKREGYVMSERRYGAFQRSFQLPDDVDAAGIEASLKNGVLTLALPKSAEAKQKVRKVAVKAG